MSETCWWVIIFNIVSDPPESLRLESVRCFRRLGPRTFEETVLMENGFAVHHVGRFCFSFFLIILIKVLNNIYSVTGDVNEMMMCSDIRRG